MSAVLVVSPHPDDESIGCGGTLRKHVLQGDTVAVIHLTSGELSGHKRPDHDPDAVRRRREAEAQAAASILGVTHLEFWHESDGQIRATQHVVDRLRAALDERQPDILYTPHAHEAHADHRATARIVQRALAALGSSALRPTVLTFEVWTPLQQVDDVVDISAVVDIKRAAIQAHTSQCDLMRFDDAALALARYRGEMHNRPGGDYAEVFAKLC